MKFRLRFTVLAIALFVAISSLVFTVRANTKPEKTDKSEKQSSNEAYILTEYNDKIAIFERNGTGPIMVFDVSVSSLPQRDITRIKKGVPTSSLEEAVRLIEDYE